MVGVGLILDLICFDQLGLRLICPSLVPAVSIVILPNSSSGNQARFAQNEICIVKTLCSGRYLSRWGSWFSLDLSKLDQSAESYCKRVV